MSSREPKQKTWDELFPDEKSQRSDFDRLFPEAGAQRGGPITATGAPVHPLNIMEPESGLRQLLAFFENQAPTVDIFSPQGVGEMIIDQLLHPTALQPSTATMGVLGTGMFEAGFTKPVSAALGLLGARGGGGFSNRTTDFIDRVSQGMISSSEKAAVEAGVPLEEIAAAHSIGNFIGFVAPISASVKGGQVITRTNQALAKHVFLGDLITDTAAGLIYGGIFSEGEGRERLSHMIQEAATFGAFRLVLSGLPVFSAWRHKRARELDVTGNLSKRISDAESGIPNVIEEHEIPDMLQQLNDENFIMHSGAAQDMLRQRGEDLALQQAIVELAQNRGTGGVFKAIGHTFEEAAARIERFKQQFPTLKFSVPIRRETMKPVPKFTLQKGEMGAEAATADALAPGDFLLEGEQQFFWNIVSHEGKVVGHINSTLQPDGMLHINEMAARKGVGALGTRNTRALLGRALDEVESATGAQVAGLTGMRETGTHPGIRYIPRESFRGSVETVDVLAPERYDAYFGTKGLNAKQLKQIKAEGRFEGQVVQHGGSDVLYVSRSRRKEWVKVKDGDGKIYEVKEKNITDTPFVNESWEFTPEWDALYKDFSQWVRTKSAEVRRAQGGLPEAEMIQAVKEGRIQLRDDARRALDQGGAIVHPEEIGLSGENAIEAVVSAPMAVSPTTQDVTHAIATRGRASPWEVTILDPEGQPAFTQGAETLEEALAWMSSKGFQPQVVRKRYAQAMDVEQLISHSGTDQANLLEAPPMFSNEQLFDFWAADRGLPKDALDYSAARISSVDRLRRELWAEVPVDARKAYDQAVAEYRTQVASEDFPIESLANMKGFYYDRLEGGRVRLREVASGNEIQVGSERLARNVLQQIIVPEKEMPGLLASKFSGLQLIGEGYPIQYELPEMIASLEFRNSLPFRALRNLSDFFRSVDEQTGVPFFSRLLDDMLQGYDQYMNAYEPFAKEIQSTWKGISMKRKYDIADFWIAAEEQALSPVAAAQAMQELGFSAKEIQAFRRSRAIMDLGFELSGLERARYIQMYYSRVRPFSQSKGFFDAKRALGDMELKPAEKSYWYEHERTGDMVQVEKDPEMVMHRYFRSVLWKNHVKQPWDAAAVYTGTTGRNPPMKIKDLPPDVQERVMQNAAPGTTHDSAVVPKELRDVLSEFLTSIRGMPSLDQQSMRSMSQRLFKKMGITTDARVLEEVINTWTTMQYGAALGLRPVQVMRNMSQNLWMQWTRIGNANNAMGRGLERAMTHDGFIEVANEGVLRLQEAGVPYADLNAQVMLNRAATADDGGMLKNAVAGMVRKGLRAGSVSREVARVGMVPYSSSDQLSRSWSYFHHKYHTSDLLRQFEEGTISWEKFQEQGLPFFSEPTLKRFRETYNMLGHEAAVRYIGRQAANETNFIYFTGIQPAWLQKTLVRPFGMFFTWPLWMGELYASRIKHATLGQQATLFARTGALAAIFSNMTMQLGIDMGNWIAPKSLFGWSGGPAVEHAFNLKQVQDAPLDQKASAFKRFVEAPFKLSFPGQLFLQDLQAAQEQYEPNKALMSLLLGRPVDQEHWAMTYQFDPQAERDESWITPEIEQEIRVPWLPDPGRTSLTIGQPDPLRIGDRPLQIAPAPAEPAAPQRAFTEREQRIMEEDAIRAAEGLLRLTPAQREEQMSIYSGGAFPPEFGEMVRLRVHQLSKYPGKR